MVDRIVKQNERLSRPQVQGVPANRQAIKSMEDFAVGMMRLNDTYNKILDNKTVREASIYGAIEGQNPNYRPRADNTIAADAFNRAANEVFLSNLQLNTREQISEFKALNPADPASFSRQVDAYTNKIIEGLTQDNPALVQPYRERVFQAKQSAVKELTADHQEKIIQAATAGAVNNLDQIKADALEIVYSNPLDNDTAANIASARNDYIRTLLKHGPSHEFEYSDIRMDTDITRPSLYTVDEINDLVNEFDDDMMVNRAMGNFNRLLIKKGLNAAIVAVEGFRRRNVSKLRPEVKEEILKRMTTDIARAGRAQTVIDELTEDNLEADQDDIAKEGDKLAALGVLDWIWLDAHEADLNKSDYRVLTKHLTPGDTETDTNTVLFIEGLMDLGNDATAEIREAYLANKLSETNYRDLRDRNEKFFGRKPEIDYKQAWNHLYDLTGGGLEFVGAMDDLSLQGAAARGAFQQWYNKTKAMTGELPSYRDQMDKVREVVEQYYSIGRIKKYLNNTVPKPLVRYRVYTDDPNDLETLDVDATREMIKIYEPGISKQMIKSGKAPPEVYEQLRILDEYEQALDQVRSLEATRRQVYNDAY